MGDSQTFVTGFRTTGNHRFNPGITGGIIGFGNMTAAQRFEGRSIREDVIRDCVRRGHPALADLPFADSWYGPIDRTRSGLPLFGALPNCPSMLLRLRLLRQRRRHDADCRAHPGVAGAGPYATNGPNAGWCGRRSAGCRRNRSAMWAPTWFAPRSSGRTRLDHVGRKPGAVVRSPGRDGARRHHDIARRQTVEFNARTQEARMPKA